MAACTCNSIGRQDREFEASLNYKTRPSLQKDDIRKPILASRFSTGQLPLKHLPAMMSNTRYDVAKEVIARANHCWAAKPES